MTLTLSLIRPADDDTLIYQTLRRVLEQSGYIQVIPVMVIANAITSQAESDAVAVAEGYALGVLGTFRREYLS